MKQITIVHLADLHVSEAQAAEFKKRSRAFIADLEYLKIIPDLVIISGDVSFSGKKAQYDIVRSELLVPLCKKMHLDNKRVVLAMGNHDIDRSLVDNVFETGLLATVRNGDYKPLMDDAKFHNMEGAFIDFCMTNGYAHGPVEVYTFDRLKIGVAVLNSTRLCLSKDCQPGSLRIPIESVNSCLEPLEDCAFRIATFHHPFNWFVEDDTDSTIGEIKHSFDLILNGHIHDSRAEGVVSPNASYLQATVSSFFKGSAKRTLGVEGYSIYQIDPREKIMKGIFRKYAHARHEFDKDTDSARDGTGEYKLPCCSLARQSDYALWTQSDKIRDVIKGTLEKNASIVQQLNQPIYVEPNIYSAVLNSHGEIRTKIVSSTSFNEHICIFHAGPDVGSTTFFQKWCCDLNEKCEIAVIVDAKDLSNVKTEKHLLGIIKRNYHLDASEEDILQHMTLVVDEFHSTNSEDIIRIIGLCKRVRHLIFCVKSSILFDALLRGNTRSDIAFYEFRYWSANKVKEFILKYAESFGNNLSNLDSAVRFIVHSFSHTDLPVTPFLVGMYLRIFFEGNGILTSLNFVDLLERMETNSFSQVGTRSTLQTKHYYRKFLAIVATRCQEAQSLIVDRKQVENDFQGFIDRIGVDADVAQYPLPLITAGILITPNEKTIGFSCYAFFRYYLALSFEGEEEKLLAMLGTIGDIQAVGDAVPYYIHKHRGCKKLCDEILLLLKESMHPLHEVFPKDLDCYAKEILSPVIGNGNAEEAANRIQQMNEDNAAIDQDFELRQAESHKEEEWGLKRIPAQSEIDRVSQNIVVLRILYNVFRNLEEVEFQDKCATLDAILSLHSASIMQMIKCFSELVKGFDKLTSLFAYLVSIWGSGFLSEHIASDTLKKVVCEVHDKTDNPLKKFLLICIMIELGMSEAIDKLVSLVLETESTSILEMSFYKIKECLIRYDKRKIPSSLIDAFKQIYNTKARREGESKRQSDRVYGIEINAIQKWHIQHWQERLAGKTGDLDILLKGT